MSNPLKAVPAQTVAGAVVAMFGMGFAIWLKADDGNITMAELILCMVVMGFGCYIMFPAIMHGAVQDFSEAGARVMPLRGRRASDADPSPGPNAAAQPVPVQVTTPPDTAAVVSRAEAPTVVVPPRGAPEVVVVPDGDERDAADAADAANRPAVTPVAWERDA